MPMRAAGMSERAAEARLGCTDRFARVVAIPGGDGVGQHGLGSPNVVKSLAASRKPIVHATRHVFWSIGTVQQIWLPTGLPHVVQVHAGGRSRQERRQRTKKSGEEGLGICGVEGQALGIIVGAVRGVWNSGQERTLV